MWLPEKVVLMGQYTGIKWTNATVNFATGCTKIGVPKDDELYRLDLGPPSECKFCYMFEREYPRMKRLQESRGVNLALQKYQWSPDQVHLFPSAVQVVLHWKEPKLIFVNSMSDTFHERIPFDWLLKYWMPVVNATPQHVWQVLTKRPYRMAQFSKLIGGFPKNVWAGTSVGHPAWLHRLEQLSHVEVQSGIRFWSCEPLLGSFEVIPVATLLKRYGIRWLIVGGESGEHLRDPKWYDRGLVRQKLNGSEWVPKEAGLVWVRDLLKAARAARVPFFFKQWGGPKPSSGGDVLDGKIIQEFP